MFKQIVITSKILLLSGLHIGGSDAGVKIGGIDNPVIKNPISKLPYIPGSSLKGKIRFLLEHYYGLEDKELDRRTNTERVTGNVTKLSTEPTKTDDWSNKRNEIAVIFGVLPNDLQGKVIYPTRVIFRDCNVKGAFTGAFEGKYEDNLDMLIDLMNSRFVEGKYEVAIDRIKGTAKDGALRQIERVPAGTVFDFEIVLRSFESGDMLPVADGGNNHIEIIKKGLKLLENDALGGYGSRGGGRIKFFDLKIDAAPFNLDEVIL